MVENILRNVPESRNSDITLMIEIWKRYYPQRIKKGASGEEGVWLRDLYDLPREDGVKRIRASFNHEGKISLLTGKLPRGEELKRTCGVRSLDTLQRQIRSNQQKATVIWIKSDHLLSPNYSTIKHSKLCRQ